MKPLTRDRALSRLKQIKDGFARYIASRYAHRARDCGSCSTPCCADAEFVNVNITRLEAEAILATIRRSPRFTAERRERILDRAREAVRLYGLDRPGDTFATTYACPLFENGCLVHYKAKPAPCTQHGCYDRWQDLPDALELGRVEKRVAALNRALYGEDESVWGFRTIPAWLAELAGEEAGPCDDDGDALDDPPVLVSITPLRARR